jgi:hypothetical protein
VSSTGRGGIRLDSDAYETPGWVYDQFLPSLKGICPDPQTILEPGAGTGNLVRGLRKTFPSAKILAVEIREECGPFLGDADQRFLFDFENPTAQHLFGTYDLVFGNPPFGGPKYLPKSQGGGPNPNYGQWLRFVQRGIDLLTPTGVLIFLLRMAVLEGTDRNPWMRMHVPDVYVLPKRPSFTGQGNDSAAYAWMVWGKEPSGMGTIRILPNP